MIHFVISPFDPETPAARLASPSRIR